MNIFDDPEFCNSGDAWEKAVEDGIMEEFVSTDEYLNYKRAYILGHLEAFCQCREAYQKIKVTMKTYSDLLETFLNRREDFQEYADLEYNSIKENIKRYESLRQRYLEAKKDLDEFMNNLIVDKDALK